MQANRAYLDIDIDGDFRRGGKVTENINALRTYLSVEAGHGARREEVRLAIWTFPQREYDFRGSFDNYVAD